MRSETEGQLPMGAIVVNDDTLTVPIEEERRLTAQLKDSDYNSLVKARGEIRETIRGKLPVPEDMGEHTFLVNERDLLTITRTTMEEHTVDESVRTRFKSEPA